MRSTLIVISSISRTTPSFIDWQLSRQDYRDACDNRPTYLHHRWKLLGTDELYNVYASYIDHSELTTSRLSLRWQRGSYKIQGA